MKKQTILLLSIFFAMMFSCKNNEIEPIIPPQESKLKLETTTLSIIEGETKEINIQEGKATDLKLSLDIAEASLIENNKKIRVKATKPGSAVLTVYSKDKAGKVIDEASIDVTIISKDGAFRVEPNEIKLKIGESSSASIIGANPDNVKIDKNLDPSVADITLNGNKIDVKALKEGKTTIILESAGISTEFKIVVAGKFRVEPNQIEMKVGETSSVAIIDADPESLEIEKNSNTSVADVKLNGSDKMDVTAKQAGETTISLKSAGVSVELKIKVSYAELIVDKNAVVLKLGDTAHVNITSGNGDYEVVSSEGTIASAKIVNKKIEITSLKIGEAILTLTDNASKKTAEIKVTVERKHTPTLEIQWVDIPAGTFTMGSPTSEPDRSYNETQHEVSLSAFKISRYPITFDQFDAFCDATGRTNKPYAEDWGRGNRPVIHVTYEDAVAYAKWLGDEYRLPTEAEWEYACRAGTTTSHHFAIENLDDYVWHRNNSGEKTNPVGEKQPNAWDLYDMNGNVWEWCYDWAGNYPTGAQSNPKGPDSNEYSLKVIRGGSWNNTIKEFRSAKRSDVSIVYNPYPDYYGNYDDDNTNANDCGFRLVKVSKDHPIQP